MSMLQDPPYFTMEIKQIIQKYYPSWETMEDFDYARAEYWGEVSSETSRSDTNDLEKELERLEKLYSDLKGYDQDHYKKSLHDVIEIAKHQIVRKFPGIHYNELFTQGDDQIWVPVILQERTVNDIVYYCDDCESRLIRPSLSLATLAYGRNPFASHLPPLVTDEKTEVRLNELYEELATNRSKVLEAQNLCMSSNTVCQRVNTLIENLKTVIQYCKQKICCDNNRRQWKEQEEKEEQARKLMEEKLQCLCNVMKEVLNDRVEDVVFSCHLYSSAFHSPCFLRDSGMGRKIMEINPHDLIIRDLQMRYDANKNDIHLRDATLLLFNHAELYRKAMQQQGMDTVRYGTVSA